MAGDIIDIKRALAQRAESVAAMLLPAGKRDGSEWRVGSVNGEPGRTLGVHLKGAKAGVWMDFADTGEWGDLIDLWSRVKGIKLAQAIEEARKYLGMERQQPFRDVMKTYKKPPKPACNPPRERVRDYLREERNLSDEAITAYKIGERGSTIYFPLLKPSGELSLVLVRSTEKGGYFKPTSDGAEPILGGWQAIPDDARQVVITEGPFDAVSWYDYGHPALTVPFGGGKGAKQTNWIENDYDNMERFEVIYLALDNDEQGDLAAAEIASRLGRHRCKRVTHPGGHKDGNDCLVAGVTREDMETALLSATSLDPAGLNMPSHYRDKVVDLFWPADGIEPGCRLPYRKVRDKIVFRAGEVTAWQGETGAGKSQVLSDSICDWVNQGERVCLSSLEMLPQWTLKRMCKQVGGVDRPTVQYIDAILKWLDQGLLVYGLVGKSGIDALLEVFDYARAKYGCTQFVIDSFMRIGIAGDDYTAQEQAMFKMVNWAIENMTHVHIVTHSRKGSKEHTGPQDTSDIKGASEIGNNVANVIGIWRNKKLEEDIAAAEGDNERLNELLQQPGVTLSITKQRNGDWEGKIGLWFDKTTYRYRSSHDGESFKRNYVAEIVTKKEAA